MAEAVRYTAANVTIDIDPTISREEAFAQIEALLDDIAQDPTSNLHGSQGQAPWSTPVDTDAVAQRQRQMSVALEAIRSAVDVGLDQLAATAA